jgi:hypothetical protein
LLGGDGADVFDVDATLTGSIDGEGGADTLQGDLIDDVVLTGSDAAGFDGTEADVTGGFDGIDILTGDGGTLTGENVDSTWELDGTPTYNDGTNTLSFSGFANLQGGTMFDQFNISAASPFSLLGGDGNDTFSFTDPGSVTGSVDGQVGTDTLDLSAITTTRVISLLAIGATDGFNGNDSTSDTDSFDEFRNIDIANSGSANDDVLNGLDTVNTWTIDDVAGDNYLSTARNLANTGFEVSNGGADVDTFNIVATTSGATSRNLSGGAANDGFNFSPAAGRLDNIAQTVIVNGQGDSASTRDVRTGDGMLTPLAGNGALLSGTTYVEDPTTALPEGDTINLNDVMSPTGGGGEDFNVELTDNASGRQVVSRGPDINNLVPLVELESVRLLNIEGGLGDETVSVNLPDLGFSGVPIIITLDGNTAGAGLVVVGSNADDFIVVQDGIGGLIRSAFEVDSVNYVHLRGFAGNDVIINDTIIPALLEGGDGVDVLVGGDALAPNVDPGNPATVGTDVMFGGLGADAIFGNRGTDYLLDDLSISAVNSIVDGRAVGLNCVLVLLAGPNDLEVCIDLPDVGELSKDLLNGGLFESDNAVASGGGDILRNLGGGDIIQNGAILSVLDWLQGRFLPFSVGAVLGLVQRGLQGFVDAGGELQVTPMGGVPEGEVATLNNPLNSFDINDDGHVSPVDVLHVVNEVNTFGSYEVGNRPVEGEQAESVYYDANGDNHISSGDALAVINFLNGGGFDPDPIVVDSDETSEGEGEANIAVAVEPPAINPAITSASDPLPAWLPTAPATGDSSSDSSSADAVFAELVTAPAAPAVAPAADRVDWSQVERELDEKVDEDLLEAMIEPLTHSDED